jgi:AcrR family transcriptional regulator
MAKDQEVSPFPTAEERSQDRHRKREALLRAAVRMFNARGFHATTLDDVANSLGVTKPTIYHYFGNKENILLECVERGLSELSAAARAAAKDGDRGLERLRAFLIRYAEINMDDFGRCVIRTADEQLSPDGRRRFRAAKADIDRALRAMIEDGVADRSVAPQSDVKLAAFALAGALNWPARWFDPKGPRSSEEVARTLVETLLNGFTPEPEGPASVS